MKTTKQLSCTFIDHSRKFFLQVKNILSYNCIHKPDIIQRNIIDCMELRSAEIRSHIVIRRSFRVYSLCVSSSSAPASWSGQNDVPFFPSILLHCRHPAPNKSSSHVVFKSSLHVVFESSVYCAWRIPELLRCTQCSILLHIMDICFLTCICL